MAVYIVYDFLSKAAATVIRNSRLASTGFLCEETALFVIHFLPQLNKPNYIFSLLSHLPHHREALNSLICADAPLRN